MSFSLPRHRCISMVCSPPDAAALLWLSQPVAVDSSCWRRSLVLEDADAVAAELVEEQENEADPEHQSLSANNRGQSSRSIGGSCPFTQHMLKMRFKAATNRSRKKPPPLSAAARLKNAVNALNIARRLGAIVSVPAAVEEKLEAGPSDSRDQRHWGLAALAKADVSEGVPSSPAGVAPNPSAESILALLSSEGNGAETPATAAASAAPEAAPELERSPPAGFHRP